MKPVLHGHAVAVVCALVLGVLGGAAVTLAREDAAAQEIAAVRRDRDALRRELDACRAAYDRLGNVCPEDDDNTPTRRGLDPRASPSLAPECAGRWAGRCHGPLLHPSEGAGRLSRGAA